MTKPFLNGVCSIMSVALAVGILSVAGGPILGLASEPPRNARFRIFDPPPPANDFRMVAPDDKPFKLSDLFGKVLILNFWRQQCRFCPMEKTHIRLMLKSLKNPNVLVVYVNLWDKPSWVKAYASRHPGPYVFGMRSDKWVSLVENVVRGRKLGYYIINSAREAVYEIRAFPSSYVIDKKGRVVATHLGMADWSKPSIRKWIESLARQD